MAATEETEVREELRKERRQLAESLDELRGELDEATDVAAKLGGVLPVAVAGAFGAGFFFGGGIGATVRYFLRRSRER
ncbi:MAG TPA: hypothetical protein VE088_01260 [Gaiellaceae bacterium]|jgi:hypothetical protein|nr:hypothetical protein [Gaiellaceae bacterium]